MRRALLLLVVTACRGAPPAPPPAAPPPPGPPTAKPVAEAPRPPDPDLNRPPPKKLITLDWDRTPLATDADALAAWAQIAPTGDNFELVLDEIPAAAARPLAIALLHGGNFTCVTPQPPVDCAPLVLDEPNPAPTAGFSDPCLRRLLALWALDTIDDADVPAVMDALRGIASLPPPESQLVAAALAAVPESDHDRRLELLARAQQAGQHDLANSHLSSLDEPHLIAAVEQHHLDGALDLLSAQNHRAVFLAAIADDALLPKARAEVIGELLAADEEANPGKLPGDTRAALVAAARTKDCFVAATAARALELRGDKRFVPKRPRTSSPARMMRALCVLASYERSQPNDESSLFPTFVPAKGLEHVKVAFDPLSEVDTDGDGDPRTDRTVDLIPRADVVLPEIDDLVRAFRHCKGTVCSSDDRDFRFDLKPVGGELWVSGIELIDRPPCPGH